MSRYGAGEMEHDIGIAGADRSFGLIGVGQVRFVPRDTPRARKPTAPERRASRSSDGMDVSPDVEEVSEEMSADEATTACYQDSP